ncbi:MAG: response regulator transcription factor [Acidobacteria bacterium]|nr:response regulator transcription factor [Acidobacteriota bacterium]MCI0720570.1 response regulator transcription factor [Acidobacteriota bacterium]
MRPDPTVFVVDDDPAVRDSLRWLIESVGLPVETFNSARNFLDRYDPNRPGCLVLDIRMPGMSGADLQEQLASRALRIPIIIITGHADLPMAVRTLKNGALDFIEKPFSDQVLLNRIQQAIQLDLGIRDEKAEQAEIAARVSSLTPREREVMNKVIAGKPNKVIADELSLSQKTVEVHRANLMKKMRAESLADLVRMTLLQSLH